MKRPSLLPLVVVVGWTVTLESCTDAGPQWEVASHNGIEVIRTRDPLTNPRGGSAVASTAFQQNPAGSGLDGLMDAKWIGGTLVGLTSDLKITVIDQSGTVIGFFRDLKGKEHPIKGPVSLLSDSEEVSIWYPEAGILRSYSRDGDFLSEDTLMTETGDLFPGFFWPRNPPRLHGDLVQWKGALFFETRPIDQQTVGDSTDLFLIRFGDGGGPPDTIATRRAPSYAARLGDLRICCMRPCLFTPQPWWGFQQDGTIVFTSGLQNRIEFFDTLGTTKRVVQWPTPQESLDKGAFLRYVETDHLRTGTADSPEEAKRKRKAFERTAKPLEYYLSGETPAITQMFVDGRDRVWTRRFDHRVWPDGLSQTWDVFSRHGRFLGTIDIPGLESVFEIKGDLMIGSYTKGPGREFLKVVKIPRTF